MNDNDPLISVVVPTFQHARFIEECIESILAQDFNQPWELLIGEDGSTDGTREICLRIAEAHPGRVYLLLNDVDDKVFIDGKPTGRRNVINLYRRARGRYIAVCEGDDRWDSPEKLSKQFEIMESDPSIAASFHDTQVIDESGKIMRRFRENLPPLFTKDSIVDFRAAFHTSSILFRNIHQFEDVPHWYYRIASFDMLLFNLLLENGVLLKVEGVLSSYRKHGGGVTAYDYSKGPSIHFHRIILWLRTYEEIDGFKRNKIFSLVEWHFREILKLVGKREGLSWYFRIVMESPARLVISPGLFYRLGRVLFF